MGHIARIFTGSLCAAALLLPGSAGAKKNPYEGKLYNGQPIEEYCAAQLGVESFDLTEDDLAACDKRYEQELEGLEDLTLGDIQLDGDRPRRMDDEEAEAAESREPKLSKKELEERRLAEEAEKRKKMEDLGLVEFEEEVADDDDDGDEEEDPFGDDDDEAFGDDDFEEDIDIPEEDDLIEDYDEGSGSSLDDLEDDFGEEPSDKKKKDKKKKKKKDKKKSGDRYDDAMDIPDEWTD